ncbi:hypothetical protein NDU88_002883 [Pleurodeles waltl]|uniref:Uncharacterized protein n=1 Tax=Pleurodeles waltl TaxID=8319 RepID=A0AAV7UDM5_PLEWA|nr:hypothetical protein NDU88_002883 [Pleurodeles waltl]
MIVTDGEIGRSDDKVIFIDVVDGFVVINNMVVVDNVVVVNGVGVNEESVDNLGISTDGVDIVCVAAIDGAVLAGD